MTAGSRGRADFRGAGCLRRFGETLGACSVKPKLKVGPLRLQPFVRRGKVTGQWQLDIPSRFTFTGRRQRMLLPSQRVAEQKACALLREIQSRGMTTQFGTPPACQKLRDIFGQWFDYEETRIRAGHKKEASLGVDVNRLGHVLDFMGDDDLASLSERRLLDYQAHRRDRKLSAATINGKLRSLRAVLSWARRQRFITDIPYVQPLHEDRKVPIILTRVEPSIGFFHCARDSSMDCPLHVLYQKSLFDRALASKARPRHRALRVYGPRDAKAHQQIPSPKRSYASPRCSREASLTLSI